jgi:FkbM family methyltransferase
MLGDVIRRAGMRNCSLNHFALAEAAGTRTLHLPGDDDGQASLRAHRHGSWNGAAQVQHHECRVTTLDEYAATLARFDFMKCDVEGAELAVVRGGREVLARHHPLLWLESNPDWTRDFDYAPPDLLTELRGLGYDIFLGAGAHLAPLEESHLSSEVNLLCACARHHRDRLAGLKQI